MEEIGVVKVAGRELRVTELSVGQQRALVRHFRRVTAAADTELAADRIQAIPAGVPDDVRRAMTAEIMRTVYPYLPTDGRYTPAGAARELYERVKRTHPEVQLKEMEAVLAADDAAVDVGTQLDAIEEAWAAAKKAAAG